MSNIVKIKYKIRTDYCSCCDRPFEEESREIVEREGEIDVKDMLSYLRGHGSEVYAEDLIRYADEYTFEVLNDFISRGKTAYPDKQETNKIIKAAYEYIKRKNSGMTIVGEDILQRLFEVK